MSSSYIRAYYWCCNLYTSLFGDPSAPDDVNFKCFRAEWPKIDLSKDYHILEMSSEWLREKSKLVICELQQIIEAFVREDYRQCAENTLALLGSAPSDFFYHKPGAISNTRWMGKVLCYQKMLMWSDQLSYDGEFVKKASTNKFVYCTFLCSSMAEM